jgi:uncharacterized protein (TIGR02246 family)
MADELIQQLLDVEAIKQLKARYCICVATEDWKTFESLFAEDLQFLTPDGEVHEPRSGFMAFHKKNLQDTKVWGVVHCYTPIITITGPDSATGIWGMEDVHIYPDIEGPQVGHHGYGHYHEDYVRLADGWHFKRIRVVYERMDPLAGGFGPGAV